MIKLLYVDDHDADRELATIYFANSEINIKCVENVSHAFEELSKTDYNIIVCDMMMPSDDGLSFIKKAASKGMHTPMILISGIPALKSFDNYNGVANYLGFILKPLTPENLKKLWPPET